jgi:hypothetical protein
MGLVKLTQKDGQGANDGETPVGEKEKERNKKKERERYSR